MPQSKEPALIEHGIALLAAALGTDATRLIERQPGTGQRPQVDWDAYRQVLAPHARDPAPVLDSICAGVSLRPGGPEVEGPCCLRPGPLALNSRALMPTTADEALPGDGSAARADLWAQFTHQWDRAGAMGETGRFERFFYLFQKYTWAVPCSYGEPGVSLFEEWKALAALVFASRDRWEAGPDELLLLVGGDIPGIQEFVYTISSKGAAKGLRGRSLFVQFLGDAVVQRIIADLDLSPANVIYSAGGNFMVLAPAGSAEISGSTVTAQLGRVQATVDAAMLEHLGGDLAACIAWIALPAECVGTDQFASAGAAALKGAIADRKRQRFASAFGAKWTQLFGPQGKPGNRYCVICHRPLARGERPANHSAAAGRATASGTWRNG
jgi:hypothetical protein